MWFKVNSLSATNTLFTIKNNTTAENNKTPNFIVFTDGSLRYTFWDNDIYYGGPGTIVPNKWYHVSVTYSGGSDTSSRKMFLNGVELGISSTSGSSQNTALNVYANSTLKIGVYADGTTNPFNGSIANFRLYNQALSADEIWELYAYQKEYFGVSPDVVTLKAGRLGIGTSEPRAVLDVRGGLSCQGYMKSANPVFYAVRTVSGPGPNSYIIYDLAKVNKGSHYNTSNGIFTCPVDGVYIFTFGGSGNLTNTVYRYYLRVNDAALGGVGGLYQLRIDTIPSGNDYGWGEITITADLLAGDTVRIYYTVDDNSTVNYGQSFTYFQGHLFSYS
jgi:hypothetical protein